ncbi:MAG: proprotein convertase P-domain-containing protein [Myxococcales bacterium]|nr:proprotein convertase P-domain-containing protein [Myxococcales bacterium]
MSATLSAAVATLFLSLPTEIPIQGSLRAPGGTPVDGQYAVAVRLYADASGGAPIFTQDFAGVNVEGGVFSVGLVGVSSTLLAATASPFVGVAVQGEPELPRVRLGAVPYALVASTATAIACTGCIPASALEPSLIELIGNAYTDDDAVAAVVASGAVWTKGEAASLADLLPPDGLDEISGGLISTTFEDTFSSTDTPIDIKDNNPLGIGSTIAVPDVGIAKSLEVSFVVTGHSNVGELTITLYAPDNTPIVLHDKGSSGSTSLARTFPPSLPVSGSLASYVDTNIVGNWRLQVVDAAFDTNATDGTLAGWSIAITTLSNKKLRITGDLDAEGHRVMNLGAPVDDGDAANKGYVDAAFKERTISKEFLAVAPGAVVNVTHGFSTTYVVADAWYRSSLGDVWAQTGYSAPPVGDGSDGAFAPTSNTTLAGGSYDYTTVTIPSGVTVTVTGGSALDIRARGAVNIAGTLLLSGGPGGDVSSTTGASGGAGGAGGNAGGSTVYGGPSYNGSGSGGGSAGGSSSYGGGGGGAGHAAAGASGFHLSPATCGGVGSHGSGGGGYTSIESDALVGGSGGGGGGYGGAANAGGGGGGGGGGALKISAPIIAISGTIDASGGRGGNNLAARDGGGGGGGSGGSIWLVAGEVQMYGAVTALGGAGGYSDKDSCYGGDGGAGAVGRIRIDAAGVAGNTNPPFIGTGIYGGIGAAPLRVYQPDDNTVSIQNLSIAPLDIRAVVIAP